MGGEERGSRLISDGDLFGRGAFHTVKEVEMVLEVEILENKTANRGECAFLIALVSRRAGTGEV